MDVQVAIDQRKTIAELAEDVKANWDAPSRSIEASQHKQETRDQRE